MVHICLSLASLSAASKYKPSTVLIYLVAEQWTAEFAGGHGWPPADSCCLYVFKNVACQVFFGWPLLPSADIQSIAQWAGHSGTIRRMSPAFRALHGTAPPYMTSQFTRVADMPNRRRLRSASSNQLDGPSFRLPTLGSRAFPIAGAKVWNSLPDDVTSVPSLSTFRRHLQTHLFRCCYNIL